MKILKGIMGLFLSLGTTIWLLLLLLATLLYGSFAMPMNEEFQALHIVPLFQWLLESPLSVTWWLFVSIGLLCLLTANTLFCSLESLMRKRGARQLLLVVSPQVIHLGFLFILLAHLASSYGSFKGIAEVTNGTHLGLPNGTVVAFDNISGRVDPSGYITTWSAAVAYFDLQGSREGSGVIEPNSPSFHRGFGIYVKTVRPGPAPSALIEVSRDPGAIWALVGGILSLAGMITLLMLKIRHEDAAQG